MEILLNEIVVVKESCSRFLSITVQLGAAEVAHM